MPILHKNITASGDIHNPKWHPDANNGDYAWKNEKGELESIDELLLPAALNFVDGSVAPPTSNTNDIYILSSGGSVNAGWGSVALQDWVKYDGAAWNAITPQKSSLCYDKTADSLMSFNGTSWAAIGGGGTDPNAVHVNAQSEISGITAKPTPTTNDILLIEDAADNNNKKKITIGDLPSGGGGVFGITNASGIYTYYTTIELALSAASSGTVIEQFSNVSVSTSTTINLIDGVTWNMNGYEYKNTSNGSFTMFEIPTNTTVKFAINNGYIKRNTGSSNGGILLDTKNTLASEIIINGVTFENIEGTSAKGEATLIGGIFRSSSTTQIGFEYSGTVNNIKVFSYNGNKVQSSLSVVEVFNSTFYSENSANNINNVNAYNSNFTSDGDSGLSFGNGTSNCYNCVGSSTASHGIYVFNGELHNCSGFSTAGFGIQLGSSNSVVYSSIGKSTANNGFNLATSSRAFNCYAESSANAGVRFVGAGVFTNGVAKSTGTSIFAQAVFCNVSGAEVTNCDLIVTTASNNCISGNALKTAKLANNTYKGSTVAVNANITNSVTNTQDNQGNILI